MNTTAAELKKLYNEEAYHEKKRNYRFYKYGKGRRLLSIDNLLSMETDDAENDDPAWTSDRGASVERMVDYLDRDNCPEEDPRLVVLATAALIAAVYPHLLYTFLLIVKNGKHREASICELRKATTKNNTRQLKDIIEILKNC